MPELLIEFFSEEIPARMQVQAEADLARLLAEQLTAAGLSHGAMHAFSTPRRLAVGVEDVPIERPAIAQEKKGPKVGAPDQAVAGFLKAHGLASLDDTVVKTVGKADFHFAVNTVPGAPTPDLLPAIIGAVIRAFPWPKSMRWATGRRPWVRPLTQILCVFDHAAVAGVVDFDGVSVPIDGRTTGHRFMAPDPLRPMGASDYTAALAMAKVMAERATRKDAIATGAAVAAEGAGLRLRDDPGLLEEVTGLVEWPVALLGRIDDRFMDLPPEVLTTSMRAHQKYFACETRDGTLAPHFVVIANMETADEGAAIVAGNERVLRARLADARFFWDQDRAIPLAARLPDLDRITFHAKLGTVAQRAERLGALSRALAAHIPGCDPAAAEHAGRLAKTDLTTGMVGEFPELQGLMGRYYARDAGEDAAVADALADHYKPLGPTDTVPSAPVSIAVALADKLDALVGFFGADERPTGSKDPYALRRAALGVIRLVLDNGLRLPLTAAFAAAAKGYADQGLSPGDAPADLLDFLADRLKVALKARGVGHDRIAAAFATPTPEGGREDDLTRLVARVDALDALLAAPDGGDLLAGYRRAANILRIEEKKDGRRYNAAPDPARLAEPAEQALAGALDACRAEAGAAITAEDFARAMTALASLRAPMDAFFTDVTVNADDAALRENRLALLASARAAVERVADLSQIEGG